MEKSNLNSKSISHFKGFHALRFFAALMVVFHHAESLRKDHGLEHLKAYSFFNNGDSAVTFFFVLSGFLITYLLEKEFQERGKIAVGWFYWKRVVRIWPLYFLLLIIGLGIQPALLQACGLLYEIPYSFGETWYFFLFFVPGLVTYYFGNHLLEPLWSIGVEEVFYVLWAPIYRFLRRFLIVIIISIVLLKLLVMFWIDSGKLHGVWAFLWRTHQFEAMALGGGAALVFYHFGDRFQSRVLRLIGIIVFVLFGTIFLTNQFNWPRVLHHYLFDWTFFKSVCYALLLLCLNFMPKIQSLLSNKIFEWGGNVSYGIYMLHLVVLTGTIEVAKVWSPSLPFFLDEVLYYLLSIGLTLLCAQLSSKTIEKFFLRFRSRFQPRD
jgi:peptidoglycan/LPS O-acetylase OafA/YrhL